MVYLASSEVIAPVKRAKGKETVARELFTFLYSITPFLSVIYTLEKGKRDRDFLLISYSSFEKLGRLILDFDRIASGC